MRRKDCRTLLAMPASAGSNRQRGNPLPLPRRLLPQFNLHLPLPKLSALLPPSPCLITRVPQRWL